MCTCPLGGPEEAERGQHDSHDEFESVFWNSSQWGVDDKTDHRHDYECSYRSQRGSSYVTLRGPKGQNDEHDLESLEENAFECDGHAIPVGTSSSATCRPKALKLLFVDGILIVERLQARRPHDCLAQPLETKDQEQSSDDQTKRVEGDAVHGGAQHRHDGSQSHEGSARADNDG